MTDPTPVKKVGRAAAYPLIRLLEPRFADIVRRLTDTRQAVHDEGAATREAVAGFEPMIASYAASSGESLTFVGTQLRELADELRALGARADGDDAAVAPAAPDPGGIEQAFALRALAAVAPPARVLDVRGADRTLALQLGTLGYAVTGADPRPYAHDHPGLVALEVPVEALEAPEEPFDAAIALSGLAGAGVDARDPWAADAGALAHLRTLLAPGALVVLALPAGDGVGGGRPHYDAERLEALLDGWSVAERVYLREQLPGTWVRAEAPAGRALALVAATAR